MTDSARINEDELLVIKTNEDENAVYLDSIEIKPSFQYQIILLSDCNTMSSIVDFFKKNNNLKTINGTYSYCVDLQGIYQSFSVNISAAISVVELLDKFVKQNFDQSVFVGNSRSLIDLFFKPFGGIQCLNYDGTSRDKFELEEDLCNLIFNLFKVWVHAYSIQKTYEMCEEDENILMYSHRLNGWSNPVYALSKDLSVEVKTNFGYGWSSYFFVKLTYKDLELIPFSSWIEYRYAKYAQLIKYTSKYELSNEEWLNALSFTVNSCNESNVDEKRFVENFVVKECETMVKGLELLLEDKYNNAVNYDISRYNENERWMLKGEKISGALEFIQKIIEFLEIFDLQQFIDRIVRCSIIVRPLLIVQTQKLMIKMGELEEQLKILKHKKINYDKKADLIFKEKMEIRKKLIKEFSMCSEEQIEKRLLIVFPDYISFIKKRDNFLIRFNTLEYRLNKIESFVNSYKSSVSLIEGYFSENKIQGAI